MTPSAAPKKNGNRQPQSPIASVPRKRLVKKLVNEASRMPMFTKKLMNPAARRGQLHRIRGGQRSLDTGRNALHQTGYQQDDAGPDTDLLVGRADRDDQ